MLDASALTVKPVDDSCNVPMFPLKKLASQKWTATAIKFDGHTHFSTDVYQTYDINI